MHIKLLFFNNLINQHIQQNLHKLSLSMGKFPYVQSYFLEPTIYLLKANQIILYFKSSKWSFSLTKTYYFFIIISYIFFWQSYVCTVSTWQRMFRNLIRCPKCRLHRLKLRVDMKNYDCMNSSCKTNNC